MNPPTVEEVIEVHKMHATRLAEVRAERDILLEEPDSGNPAMDYRKALKLQKLNNRIFRAFSRIMDIEDMLVDLAEKGSDEALRYAEGIYGITTTTV